jgi:CheY-like chemotaxis protein
VENNLLAPVGKRKKVLVVDDDLATRKIVELFLKGEIEIESVSNSQDATDLLYNDTYSLILMDISLGKGINGVELLMNLRRLPAYKNVPVIAITAHAMVGDKEKFLSSGFNDYLSKPFAKKDLISKVRNWVSDSE